MFQVPEGQVDFEELQIGQLKEQRVEQCDESRKPYYCACQMEGTKQALWQISNVRRIGRDRDKKKVEAGIN